MRRPEPRARADVPDRHARHRVGRATDRIVRMVDGQIVDEELLEVATMVARVTLAEIDAVRMSVEEAVDAVPRVRRPGAARAGRVRGRATCCSRTRARCSRSRSGRARRRPRPASRQPQLLRRAGREVRDAVPLGTRAGDVRRRRSPTPPPSPRLREPAMTKLFGIPMGASRWCWCAARARRCRRRSSRWPCATASSSGWACATRAAARPQRADRRRSDARDGDHRRRAGHGRHDDARRSARRP